VYARLDEALFASARQAILPSSVDVGAVPFGAR